MTIFSLSRRNAWRKPLRTILLVVSVAVAFLIYGLISSFVNGTQGSAGASDNLLGVTSANGIAGSLPLSYGNRIKAEPGVSAFAYMTRLRGYAGDERSTASVSAIPPEMLVALMGRQLGLTQEHIKALGEGRDRVLAGRAIAEVRGWRVGQTITVTTPLVAQEDGSHDWRFQIAGIFDGTDAQTDTFFLIGQYDYINLGRARNRDTASGFLVRADGNVSPAALAARIDAMFKNSAYPTRTMSEKQFLEAFLRQYADIGLIVTLVVGAAFITLLMIVGNTMIFAVRERRFEIGLLRTLGFEPDRIVGLILMETVLILLSGCACGLALAGLAAWAASDALGLVLTPGAVVEALAIAVALGLAVGLLPAVNAIRIPIAAAFRTR